MANTLEKFKENLANDQENLANDQVNLANDQENYDDDNMERLMKEIESNKINKIKYYCECFLTFLKTILPTTLRIIF